MLRLLVDQARASTVHNNYRTQFQKRDEMERVFRSLEVLRTENASAESLADC